MHQLMQVCRRLANEATSRQVVESLQLFLEKPTNWSLDVVPSENLLLFSRWLQEAIGGAHRTINGIKIPPEYHQNIPREPGAPRREWNPPSKLTDAWSVPDKNAGIHNVEIGLALASDVAYVVNHVLLDNVYALTGNHGVAECAVQHMNHMLLHYCVAMIGGNKKRAQSCLWIAIAMRCNPIIGTAPGDIVIMLVG